MKFEYRFQNILELKEIEKDETQQLYRDSVKKFEEVGEQLLALLKKKEKLEEEQLQQLSAGLSVSHIKHFQSYIGNLEKTIEHVQRLVINARNQMNWYEEKLKNHNIEVKKYEKTKDKNYQTYLQALDKHENIQLDEISTLQYYQRKGS